MTHTYQTYWRKLNVIPHGNGTLEIQFIREAEKIFSAGHINTGFVYS